LNMTHTQNISSEWILDHIAFACTDFEKAKALYTGLFSYVLDGEEVIRDQGLHVMFLRPSASNGPLIELLKPLDESSGISSFLSKRGEGFHHICYRVNDLGESIELAKQHGLHILPGYPKKGSRNKEIVFFHPKDSAGVLIEICA
jgi:methylmalonyl-CoA/ethylmalonyl-CoA epimerase